ncbi:MAG: hypothetical protein J07HQW2_03639 [Haloquadratum walsbyi J07HQW2]|uniref:Uncharacterized protein n=1 Tax=Haloquadratum walsbyi J07HQW2 TaxID=1238425 RepID=U1NJM4_9EURY|nr:MAG: hypothetical protein J07HQW2_03639 [Haloquadratum walsbyi J07HQW2]
MIVLLSHVIDYIVRNIAVFEIHPNQHNHNSTIEITGGADG